MSTSYPIRKATPDDIPVIAALLTELNRFEGYDAVTSVDDLHRMLFSGTVEVPVEALVAEADGHVIGAVLYYPGYDTLTACEGYHLADMVVAQGYRRQGVGRALCTTLAAQALQKNKRWVSLTVLRKNKAAQGFYASLGMVTVDVGFMAMGERALSTLVNPN